jgi:hypothetical protein
MLRFDMNLVTLTTVSGEACTSRVLAFLWEMKVNDAGGTVTEEVAVSVSDEVFNQGLSPGFSGNGLRPFSRARLCQGRKQSGVFSLLSVMILEYGTLGCRYSVSGEFLVI